MNFPFFFLVSEDKIADNLKTIRICMCSSLYYFQRAIFPSMFCASLPQLSLSHKTRDECLGTAFIPNKNIQLHLLNINTIKNILYFNETDHGPNQSHRTVFSSFN